MNEENNANDADTNMYQPVEKDNFEIFMAPDNVNAALLEAAEAGHLNKVKQLIKSGAEINAKNKNKQTVLYVAVRGNQFAIVKYLIEQGADINAKEVDGWTILHRAVATNSLPIVQYLVDNGADIDAKTNYAKETPLDSARTDKRDQKIIDYLVNASLLLQIKLNNSLLETAEKGNLDAVKRLVEKGANVNTENKNKQTVLYVAVRGNQFAIVKYLIEQGADINAKEVDGWTILHRAVATNSLPMVQYLVDIGADINANNHAKKTPLDSAKINKKDQKIIDYLINASLLQAAEKGDLNSIKNLLNTGAQLEATNQCQWTALHHATRKNHFDMVQFLVNRGISLEAKDWEGKTALDVAMKFGHKKIETFLAEIK